MSTGCFYQPKVSGYVCCPFFEIRLKMSEDKERNERGHTHDPLIRAKNWDYDCEA